MEVKKIINVDAAMADLEINDAELSEAFSKQPSLMAYYGVLMAKAEHQESLVKQYAEQVEAVVSRQLREQAASSGEKTTEGSINAAVKISKKVAEAQKLLIDAKEQTSLAKHFCEAFRHKKDSLFSMGLQKRAEMEGEISIQQRQLQEANRRQKREQINEQVKRAS